MITNVRGRDKRFFFHSPLLHHTLVVQVALDVPQRPVVSQRIVSQKPNRDLTNWINFSTWNRCKVYTVFKSAGNHNECLKLKIRY